MLRTAVLEPKDVGFVVPDVAEQFVPDRPFTSEPPASQRLKTDLPAGGKLPLGHHGVVHLFFSWTDDPMTMLFTAEATLTWPRSHLRCQSLLTRVASMP